MSDKAPNSFMPCSLYEAVATGLGVESNADRAVAWVNELIVRIDAGGRRSG